MKYDFNNLYEIIETHSQKRKNKVALFSDDKKITYGQLKEKADTLAAFLTKKGVKKGDKVALFLRNSSEFIYSIFAVSKLGAILVPINTFLTAKELDYILEDSGSSVLIASTLYEKVVSESKAESVCTLILWEGEKPPSKDTYFSFSEVMKKHVSEVAERSTLEDTAIIIYTSGTTGASKGAMLSNKNIISNLLSGHKTVNATHKDRVIVFLPMFHSFTLSIGVLLILSVGGSLVIIQSIIPFSNIFKQVLKKRVTLFFGIPDVFNAMVKTKFPWYFMWFNRLRVFLSAAAPLQAKTMEMMNKKFKRVSLLEGYGLSEASPAVAMNILSKQKVGSVGTALYGYTIKIVDKDMNEQPRGSVGEIIVQGDNVMQGYLNRPKETAETLVNGWLLTGDIGYMDEDDFLFIVDRKKDLIISRGINIYPREIEKVINGYEGVSMCAVIGIADEKSGEIPIVYIELADGIAHFDELGLKKHMKEQLANYKIPKQIHIIEALPKNATGKILKRVLKEQFKKNV